MSDETRLDDLLRHWEERRGRGESPTPEEICRNDPDLLEPFRHKLAALREADQALALALTPCHSNGGSLGTWAGPPGQPDFSLHPGAEPVPGYRLTALLGRGGYGEVWKAEGPGGFSLALKFVRLGGSVGAAELRSLEVLKGLRHPNLLSTFGAWQVGPHLIVAMELADCTLGDRLCEAQAAGSPGIPGPELLEYLREAAKGIDFLNEPRHVIGGQSGVRLQHRDIKPANILLVGTGVKVADFGLVRLLEQTHASHTGALTPAYAAPEFFAGQTSRHSDQYSLAVTYCQLRGGRLPFSGSIAEIMHGHIDSSPDLTMLPKAERPPVARALAKRPDDRWPDCRIFVEALARAQVDIRRRRRRLRAVLVMALLSAMGFLTLVPVLVPSPTSIFNYMSFPIRNLLTLVPVFAPSPTPKVEEAKPNTVKVEEAKPNTVKVEEAKPNTVENAKVENAKVNATVDVTGYTGTYDGNAHGANGTAKGVVGVNLSGQLNLGDTFTNYPGGTAHWTFSGGINYNDQSGNVAITINPATPTVTVTDDGGTYTGSAYAATGSVKGVGSPAADLGTPTFTYYVNTGTDVAPVWNSLGNTAPTDAGSYKVVASYAGSTNYTGASAEKTFTIAKANTTVDVTGYTRTYDGNAHGASGMAKGVGGVNLSGQLNLGDTFTNYPGGTAHWTFSGGINYNDHNGNVAITINPATPTVTVTDDGGTYTGSAYAATGSVKGVGSPVADLGTPTFTYSVNTGTDAAPVWNSLGNTAPTDAGSYKVVASYAGSTNYTGASAEKTFTIAKANATVEEAKPVRFAGHQKAVRCMAWHPDGDLVFSGGDDGKVWSWDPRTGKPSRSLIGHQGPVTGLAISPDGRYLLTGGEDRTVRLWDLRTGRELWKRATHEALVYCVAISPDGGRGVSAGQDLTIRLWDLKEGREITQFETQVEYWSVAFTPDGRYVLAAGRSPIIDRLQLETNEVIGHFAAHHDIVWSLACALKTDWAVSGGGDVKDHQDFRVRVWRMTDGQAGPILEGHTGAVGAVAITPNGRWVLSGAADHTVRLWDCETRREVRCFRAHRDNVECVAFAPDGGRAASGGKDGDAYVWAVTTPLER